MVYIVILNYLRLSLDNNSKIYSVPIKCALLLYICTVIHLIVAVNFTTFEVSNTFWHVCRHLQCDRVRVVLYCLVEIFAILQVNLILVKKTRYDGRVQSKDSETPTLRIPHRFLWEAIQTKNVTNCGKSP